MPITEKKRRAPKSKNETVVLESELNNDKSKAAKKSSVIKTYEEALEFLFSNTNYENAKRFRYNTDTFNLDRMYRLLDHLKDPHEKLVAIHVAGTKGKGSTCTMLASMLTANGYKTGLYTSPHVLDIRERIQIDGQMITEEEMTKLIKKAAVVVKSMHDDPPTFFEIMTAMSMMFFAKEKVDFAIFETGLGGRLDSTNVVNPIVTGITSISIDHHRQLGNTVALIAAEKAGIIKKGVPVVSVMQEPDAMAVIRKQALAMKAPITVTGKEIDFSCRFESSRELGPHNRICLSTPHSLYEHLPVPLYGEHQAQNCGLALSMLDVLKAKGYKFDHELVVKGLAATKISGRMEIVNEDPRVMIDAAHNSASLRALIQAIGQHIPYDSMVVIFGCCEDKDVDGMLKELRYGADKVIFTRIKSPRSMDPELLAAKYTELSGKMCQTALTFRKAMEIAEPAVSKGDIICVTGSFYLVGEAKRIMDAKNAEEAAQEAAKEAAKEAARK